VSAVALSACVGKFQTNVLPNRLSPRSDRALSPQQQHIMARFALLCLAALVCVALAHIEIVYPTVGVRNLAADNTIPCSSTTPSTVRLFSFFSSLFLATSL
jgi:hypothetical protein